jgi:hypothetical protein
LKIYRLRPDYAKFSLLPVHRNAFAKPGLFQLAPMRSSWEPVTFYVRDPVRTVVADFLNLNPGALAYTRSVNESLLGEIIERSGEVLPGSLESPKAELFILNTLVAYNCLDRANSKLRTTPDGSVVIQVLKYGFYPERIGDLNLFKIPETHTSAIYALAGRDQPEDEFFAQYQAGRFTGLQFEEVWSSEQ